MIFQMRFKTGILAVVLMTVILSTAAPSEEEAVTTPNELKVLKIGMIAPDFTLKDDKNVERSLNDHLGKKNVVLAFYPKDFTGG